MKPRVKNSTLIVILATLVFLASTYIHDPATPVALNNWGLKYNDIVYGVFYPVFEKPDRWFRAEDYYAFISMHSYAVTQAKIRCPIPYIDYKFEYPPLVGLTWYISTCVAFRLASNYVTTGATGFRDFLDRAARVHYYVQVSVIAVFYALTIFYLYKLGARWRRILVYLLLPSLLVYATYNWDLIAAFFALAGLYEYINKRYFRSGVLMGLSIATKLLTVGLTAWLLLELWFKNLRSESRRYVIGLFIALASTFGLLSVLAWHGLQAFVLHHATWYCENCLYMLLVRDIHSDHHRLAYMGFLALSWLFMLKTRLVASPEAEKLYWLLSLYTLVVFNYVFSPQMILILTPFSMLLLDSALLNFYTIADVSNAMIIVLFFKDSEIRRLLGLTPGFNPWTLDSPVQWFAMTRNLLLLFVLLYTGLRIVMEFTPEEPTTSSVTTPLEERTSQ